MKTLKLGIIGAGSIAAKMGETLLKLREVEAYAIASRSLTRAEEFASRWGFTKAYGSYEEMIDDPEVQLVYIASPHSHHYEHARMCILKGKPVLCEKAFTANAAQAVALVELAREKQVFLTEAIWTRYMPFSKQIKEVVDSGIIGQPYMLTANLGYPSTHRPRIREAALAGGALLDLGVYPINFASMIFGTEIEEVNSTSIKMQDTGVDEQDCITLKFKGNRLAVLSCSVVAALDRQGIISGPEGHIIVQNINNPEKMTVISRNFEVIATYERPPQISGYEHQVLASKEAIEQGWLESPYMPHKETVRIMELMDSLLRQWGASILE